MNKSLIAQWNSKQEQFDQGLHCLSVLSKHLRDDQKMQVLA